MVGHPSYFTGPAVLFACLGLDAYKPARSGTTVLLQVSAPFFRSIEVNNFDVVWFILVASYYDRSVKSTSIHTYLVHVECT